MNRNTLWGTFAVGLPKAIKAKIYLSLPAVLRSLPAMTRNGTAGETLTEMIAALGLEQANINPSYAKLIENLQTDDDVQLAIANSL